MSEKLPSYEDFIVDPKNLPSIDDLIIEEKLPSVDDFIEPPRPEEEIADLINADSADYDFSSVGAGNTAIDTGPCSIEEKQDLTEIIRLISDVRKDIPEIPEIKYYDDELKSIIERIEGIKETVIRVWDHHHEFKNDDRLLKKQILSQFNNLKQRVDEEVKQFNLKNKEAKDLSKGYFDELADEISNLPKPKYYDENIRGLTKDIKKLNNHHDYNTTNISELYRIVEELKGKQEVLKEELAEQGTMLADPPDTNNDDPLTPIDQNFVTVDQLQKHYKLFVERVQYQLASIGGGGAGFIKDLDDVSFTGVNNQLLIYNAEDSKWVGIASTALGSNNVTGDLSVTGNISCAGTITYNDVTFVDSIGVVTARSGLELGAGSITPIIAIEAATSTTTTTSASNIDTFVAATFRSAQYQIQITQGSNYHVTTLNVLHDGTSVYLNEFGTIRTGASLATFDADINSGNVRVRATPTTDSSTVFKLTKTLTRV
jgi:hypothetical protein